MPQVAERILHCQFSHQVRVPTCTPSTLIAPQIAERIGVYTAEDYCGNVEHLIERWNVKGLSGLSEKAQEAQVGPVLQLPVPCCCPGLGESAPMGPGCLAAGGSRPTSA